jgi:predicted transcriptional regulator
MAREYRTRSRLILDVLRTVQDEGEARTNRILLIANLSHARLQGLVDELEGKGWIEAVTEAEPKAWRITDAGRGVLRSLEGVDDLMRDFGLRL